MKVVVILFFVLISIVIYTTTKKSKNIDCMTSEWTEYGNCSKECGGGIKTRTRTITKNPLGTGLKCPTLTETVTCNTNPCNPLSYTYNGTITVDGLLLSDKVESVSKIETIGIIVNNILISSYKLTSVSTTTDGFKIEVFEIHIERNREIIEKLIVPGIQFLNNIVPLNSPLELKQGDIISLYVETVNGSLISITTPTVTFGLDIDCMVSDFVDQTDCLDIEGNIINCDIDKTKCIDTKGNILEYIDTKGKIANCIDTKGNIVECIGTKSQVRSILQPPLYGGKECPPLNQTVNCSPCPILSYSYDGTITLDRTMFPPYDDYVIQVETIGIINTDFVITNINVDLNFSEINWDGTFVIFSLMQNTDSEPIYFEIIYDQNNPTHYLETPILVKKFDEIIVHIAVFDGYSISLKNPKITFNVPVDCIVGDFKDISICMGSIQNDFGANCNGEKQQGRSILQHPLYGGEECPALTRYVDCPPCEKISYSFPDDIKIDRTMFPVTDPPLLYWTDYNFGLVENDFNGSIVTIDSEYTSGPINMVFVIVRDGIEVDFFNLAGSVRRLYKNPLIVASNPLLLKKGDNIILKVGVADGYSIIIQKPTMTFSTLNPAENL